MNSVTVSLPVFLLTLAVQAFSQSINECTENTHNCHKEAICTDTEQSFTCKCKLGFKGDGVACIGIPSPTKFTTKAISELRATIEWSTEGLGPSIKGYRTVLYSNGIKLKDKKGTVIGNSVLFSGLSKGTTYELRVQGIDPTAGLSMTPGKYQFKTLLEIPPATVATPTNNYEVGLAGMRALEDDVSASSISGQPSLLQQATGILCYQCTSDESNKHCIATGRLTRCHINDQSCQNTVRVQNGRMQIHKGCKQKEACESNQMQNDFRTYRSKSWGTAQCSFTLSTTVCRCCCDTNRCNNGPLYCRQQMQREIFGKNNDVVKLQSDRRRSRSWWRRR